MFHLKKIFLNLLRSLLILNVSNMLVGNVIFEDFCSDVLLKGFKWVIILPTEQKCLAFLI